MIVVHRIQGLDRYVLRISDIAAGFPAFRPSRLQNDLVR